MLSFIRRAIFGASTRDADDPWAPIVELATDKALDATDPRMRALGGHRKRLREPVTQAVHFVHELGESLPAPVEFSRASFSADPRVQAFFSSAARLREVFSTSLELEAFAKEPGNAMLERLYAALATERSERKVLVPVLRGENVQHDVERTQVSFDAHRVVLPAADEKALRRAFKERAFMTLLACALERMAGRRDRKDELEKGRAMLRAKLRAVRQSHSGLDVLSGPAASGTAASVARKLEEVERSLAEINESGGTLERGLDDLCATLSCPGEHIVVKAMCRRLSRMGHWVESGDAEPAHDIEFVQVEVPGRARVSGMLAWYPRAELDRPDVYRDRMRRALGAGSR